jgi:hypothetical protein
MLSFDDFKECINISFWFKKILPIKMLLLEVVGNTISVIFTISPL